MSQIAASKASYGGLIKLVFVRLSNPLWRNSRQTFLWSSFSKLALCSLAQAALLLKREPFCGEPYLSNWPGSGAIDGQAAYVLRSHSHSSPPKVRELIGDVLVAPVQPWDALVSSPLAIALVCLMQQARLNRFGGTCSVRPQLPLLPWAWTRILYCSSDDLSSREFLRRHLRISDTDHSCSGWADFHFEKPSSRCLFLQKALHCLNLVFTL